MRLLIALMILCSVRELRGQFADSLRVALKHKHSIDARLESRYSFFENGLIIVNGARIGVAWQRKLRLGGGISWLSTPVQMNPVVAREGLLAGRPEYLQFAYMSYYADVVFHKTKRWQLSVPLQLGVGMSWYQERRGLRFSTGDAKYLLLLYEPGITAQFKIFRWVGLGSDVAFRFAGNWNRRLKYGLNSPTYSFKLLFWPDQLYYQLFPDAVLSRKFGPAFW